MLTLTLSEDQCHVVVVNSFEVYKLAVALVSRGYVPCPCRNGEPLLRVWQMPSEPEVRRWCGDLSATEIGIVDLETGSVTAVTEVPLSAAELEAQKAAASALTSRGSLSWILRNQRKPLRTKMDEEDEILRAITNLMFKRRGRTIYDYERVNSRERILRTKPWERGRIGCVEQQIARALPHDGRPLSTGDIGRFVDEPIVKDKNAPPFK